MEPKNNMKTKRQALYHVDGLRLDGKNQFVIQIGSMWIKRLKMNFLIMKIRKIELGKTKHIHVYRFSMH